MSLQSMTGFGQGEASGENLKVSIEIKTVNHRFKDLRFKMSTMLNSIEGEFRELLSQNFKRGSFDIYINYKKNMQMQKTIEVDRDKIHNFINEILKVPNVTSQNLSINPTDFLRSDFALEDESKQDELIKLSRIAIIDAIANLKVSREAEGGKLLETLKSHRNSYVTHYKEVIKLKDSYQSSVKEKLQKRFENNEIADIDSSRFAQEVIYYLEKLDIDEEINRIQIHLEKLDTILNSKSEVGRQIEFLLQELNRETNTIGSKSGQSAISENVVQMKVQLEKLREQALNME